MGNFIEKTRADAATRRAEAEKERSSHQTPSSPSSPSHDPFYEAAIKKQNLFQTGGKVFKETGIQETLEVIGGHTITVEDGFGDRSSPAVVLRKDGNSVITTYRENGTLEIQGADTQILTAADLQNNDIVAAALEGAVKNPKKGHPSHGGDDPWSKPQGY